VLQAGTLREEELSGMDANLRSYSQEETKVDVLKTRKLTSRKLTLKICGASTKPCR